MQDEYKELAVYLMMIIDDSRIRMNTHDDTVELISNILRRRTSIRGGEDEQSIADILKNMGFEV